MMGQLQSPSVGAFHFASLSAQLLSLHLTHLRPFREADSGEDGGGWAQKWGSMRMLVPIQQQLAAIMASQCVLCVALAVSLEACCCIFAAPVELGPE